MVSQDRHINENWVKKDGKVRTRREENCRELSDCMNGTCWDRRLEEAVHVLVVVPR